jgi:hypothetical protein
MKLPSIFNCSNDMALAAHVRQYLPPKRIQQMEADLAALAQAWEDTRFAGPWGWSLATKRRYEQMGVPVEQLPSDEWLEEVRRLSSREFACQYIRELLDKLNDARLLGEEMQWVERNNLSWPHHARIFKSPWSSSGRGVFVGDGSDERTRARLQGFLSSQGGFVVDRFYEDKVLDFAMEFFIHEDHVVEFLGYSVFHAAEHGAYGYNYVESQEELLRRIDVDNTLLQQLIAYHREHLGKTAYRGPVGIDILKTADGHIHPCLEINFRLNMGILALLLHERYGSHAMVDLTPVGKGGFQARLALNTFGISHHKNL